MEDLGTAALFAVLVGGILGIVLTVYAVKIARRLIRLLDAMREEIERRN